MDAFRKPVPLLALVTLLGVSYYFLLIQMYGWSWVWSPQPEWWRESIDHRRVRAVHWLQLCHTLGVILIALPVATVVACVVPARRVVVGAAIGFAAALALIVPDLWSSPARGVALVGLRNPIVLFDYAKQMLAVPVLVWLLLRLAARNPRRGK